MPFTALIQIDPSAGDQLKNPSHADDQVRSFDRAIRIEDATQGRQLRDDFFAGQRADLGRGCGLKDVEVGLQLPPLLRELTEDALRFRLFVGRLSDVATIELDLRGDQLDLTLSLVQSCRIGARGGLRQPLRLGDQLIDELIVLHDHPAKFVDDHLLGQPTVQVHEPTWARSPT